MSQLLFAVAAGASAGLASSAHCAAMCGPLAAFACGRPQDAGAARNFALHQAGRTASYALAGAAAGVAGARIASMLSLRAASVALSWWLALVLAYAAMRVFRETHRSDAVALVQLRRKPSGALHRVLAFSARHPLLLGLANVALPCGALLSAVLLAAGTSSPLDGAALMASFALASSAGLYAVVWMSGRMRELLGARFRDALAVALAVGAIAMALRPLPTLMRNEPACAVCAAPAR